MNRLPNVIVALALSRVLGVPAISSIQAQGVGMGLGIYEDHNTRIVVFGLDAQQARAVTAELAKNAFHNVAYFPGTLDDLVDGIGEGLVATVP